MRILHIGKYYKPYSGGIENFMRALMEETVVQGSSVAAVVHDHTNGRLPKSESIGGVEVIRASSYGQLLYAPIAPSFYTVTQRAIRDFKPDVLHVHMPNLSAFFLLIMGNAKRIPWVVHWHSDVEFAKEQPFARLIYRMFYQTLEFALLKRANIIITTSPPYLSSSVPLERFKKKCCVVPLGLPDKAYERIDKKSVKEENSATLKLLSIGRLSHYKGHHILIQAMALVSEIPVELDIVGKGECLAEIKRQIEELGLGDRVKLHGYLSDEEIEPILRDCDVFCLSSIQRSEAFGLVLLEAMRAKKPCLVSNVAGSGMSWVVKDLVEGWHFENGDAQDLASKIRIIAEDRSLIERLGENGQKRYYADLQISSVSREIGKQYRNAVSLLNDHNLE